MNFKEAMHRLYRFMKQSDVYKKLRKRTNIILFLSVCKKEQRAIVFNVNKTSFDSAWKSIYRQAVKYYGDEHVEIDFLKADIVDKIVTVTIPQFIEAMTVMKKIISGWASVWIRNSNMHF